MHLVNSLASILISILLSLVIIALLNKLIPKRIAMAIMLLVLFFWMIHPTLRQKILSIAMPVAGAILPLLLVILGIRIMIRGKIK